MEKIGKIFIILSIIIFIGESIIPIFTPKESISLLTNITIFHMFFWFAYIIPLVIGIMLITISRRKKK